MRMTMRWFGAGDSVPLTHIAQVPGMQGIVGTLEGLPVGEVWDAARFLNLQAQVEAANLTLDVFESIPVSEAIKLGLPARDAHIANYCASIHNLAQAGVRVLCYNFMPLFDWLRTEMHHALPDGSTVTAYKHEDMLAFDLAQGMAARTAWARGFTGDELRVHMARYAQVDAEQLFENLVYFLRAIIPTAEAAGVYLALHPDDPPWPVFGLPRIVGDEQAIARILDAVPSPHNGLTFCTGSLGANSANDLPAMIRTFAERIHFVHLRNLKRSGDKDFHEVAHPAQYGDVDVVGVLRALLAINYTGPLRPDHGREIWGEQPSRTGYGLYDRALAATYIQGLYEGLQQG